jgi:hypothetical protein
MEWPPRIVAERGRRCCEDIREHVRVKQALKVVSDDDSESITMSPAPAA